MIPPKRRLFDDESSAIERAVLRSGVDVEPPPGAEQAVWSALAARLPGQGGSDLGGSGAAGPAAGSGAGVGILGSVGIGIVLGLGAAMGLVVLERNVPPPASVPIAAAAAPGAVENGKLGPVPPSTPRSAAEVLAPQGGQRSPQAVRVPAQLKSPPASRPDPDAITSAGAEPNEARTVRSVAAMPSEPAPPSVKPTNSAGGGGYSSRLREEALLLQRARAALRSGNAPATLSALQESRRRFPAPVLGQEREALTIEALWKSGAQAYARERARAFLKAHPTSPHAATLRPLAD
jgi:hypothetical protein